MLGLRELVRRASGLKEDAAAWPVDVLRLLERALER